jgi:hypothetical protein
MGTIRHRLSDDGSAVLDGQVVDHGYYAVDGRLVTDLKEFLLSLSGKVYPTSCQ